jgi:plastocyanin
MGASLRGLAACVALLSLAAQAATHEVTIENMQFAPATINVKRGDRIVWKNKDVVPHTATVAGSFDSRTIAPGARFSHVVRKPGRHEVICSFHPGMKATLVVQ